MVERRIATLQAHATHKGRSIEKSLRSWRRGQSLTPAAVRAWQADLFGNLIESRT
jgi:hypothetical protein